MASVRRGLGLAVIFALLLVMFAGGWLVGRLGLGAAVDHSALPELERQFAERMRNVSLVGSFTVSGRERRTAEPDRYDIVSVEKVGEDQWRFNARMDCCGVKGATLPIVVPLRWYGDTPMIMMTDTSLPGLGTFSVRVFFYGDRYAGTWQHGAVGGHMSGHIEQQASVAR